MASLIYLVIGSLDGYVEDEQGKFDWAAPDEEVHAFVNDLVAPCRHLSVRAAHVRDDGLLGDRRRSGGGGPGLRRYLACGREGCLLPDASDGVQRENPNRARVRRRGDQAAEGELAIRHRHRRGGARRPGHRRGVGRRVPALPQAGPGGRWQARPALPASMPSSSCWTSAAFAAASYTSVTVYERKGARRLTAPPGSEIGHADRGVIRLVDAPTFPRNVNVLRAGPAAMTVAQNDFSDAKVIGAVLGRGR